MFSSLCTKRISSWSVKELCSAEKAMSKRDRGTMWSLSVSLPGQGVLPLPRSVLQILVVQFRSHPRFPAPRDFNEKSLR